LKRPWRFVRLVQRLRHNMYDAVLSSTNPNSFSLSQALFARIILPQRSVGFKWGESEYLYTDVVVGRTNVFYGDAQVDLWRYFDPQAYYKPPRLYFKNDINRSPDKNVLIWLGARGRKVMSEILLSRIVKLLEDMNISYSYAAGPSDKKLVKNYSTQLVQEVEFIQGNLYDTVMFFKRFKLLIMPDTGPMHLAAATDIPLIQVFIDSNIVWYGYKGKNQFILRENDDFQTMAKFIKKHIGTTHIMEQGKILQ
jgi:ADP-heptose:LPS heptosyltransferase